LRIEGELGKGYTLEDLMEVFQRYIPRAEVEELRERARGGGGEQSG
jgi:hypothetical protein